MESEVLKAQEFLARLQHGDGGWPYRNGAQRYPEPTCYSLLALASLAGRWPEHQSKGLRWLGARLNTQGALVLDSDDEPHWTSALFLITLARIGQGEALRERCAEWLLSWRGERMEGSRDMPFDGDLTGWPWISHTLSWVEPTGYALLALKMSGYGKHPRVTEAERLLLDRACVEGGWNYGNREAVGQVLPPFPPTTALAAMALQDAPAARETVELSLQYLRREVRRYQSTLSLALTTLCMNVFDQPVDEFTHALLDRQEDDGSWRGDVHLTALAVLALESNTGGQNVFRL